MKNRCRYVLLGLVSLTITACDRPASHVPDQPETLADSVDHSLTYHALVIGIGDYAGTDWPKLNTARSDAEEIGEVLRTRYGFKVTELFDQQASRGNVLRALDQLMNLSADDALLIYFAGHGFYDKQMDEGYWIPYGAERQRFNQPAKEDWLWNSSINRVLSASPARHILLIADTCYGGSLFRGEENTESKSNHWYQRAQEVPSRYLITSGNLEPVLDSGIRHSVFAQQILNYLNYAEMNVFSASDIAVSIRSEVSQFTGQLVRMGPLPSPAHVGGEFIFVRDQQALPQIDTPEYNEPEEPVFRSAGLNQLARRMEAVGSDIRPRVLACLGPTGSSPEETARVRNRLNEQLRQLGGSILVEREAFDSLLHEMELGQSGMADHRATTEIGKLLPASLILFGEIIPFGEQKEIYLRIVDTETSRVLNSASATFETHDQLVPACQSLAAQIMKTVSEARPIYLPTSIAENETLQADWGKFHGARVGDSFIIVSRTGIDTISPKEVELGTATLLQLGEEKSIFKPVWIPANPGSTTATWLKSVY